MVGNHDAGKARCGLAMHAVYRVLRTCMSVVAPRAASSPCRYGTARYLRSGVAKSSLSSFLQCPGHKVALQSVWCLDAACHGTRK
jgi:hypothetical protein